MMQKTEKFFIFSWKELLVIVLLVVIGIGFFFTLGLHYGKKIHADGTHTEAPAGKLEESTETLPSRDTLESASRHALVATDDSIKTATQDELQKGGVKLEAPKQVDLPTQKTTVAPKTTSKSKLSPKAVALLKEYAPGEKHETAAPSKKGKYALQLGSYAKRAEAAAKVKHFEKNGVKCEIMIAEVGGSTRYRVIIPGFATKRESESRAKELKSEKKIGSYVVIKAE